MAEAEYGELFDFYCVKILAELYKNRGRQVDFYTPILVETGPANSPLKLREEAANRAAHWLEKHKYAEGLSFANAESLRLGITPLGIAAYGRPLPGKEKISIGAKAAALLGETAKSGLNAKVSEEFGQVMAQISFSDAVSWIKQTTGL